MTFKIYEATGKLDSKTRVTLEPPEDIQAFIDDEHTETTYDPRYQGLYENRYLKPGDLAELCTHSMREDYDDRDRLAKAHAQLYGDDLKTRMDAHKERQKELERLSRLTHGAVALTGKDFEHRGRKHTLADAPRLLKTVEKEIDKDFEWMHLLDRLAFRVHYAMAVQLGDAERKEMEERYRFHLSVQSIHAILAAHSRHVQTTLAGLSGRREVTQQEFQNALASLREAHTVLRDQVDAAKWLQLPPLKNMAAGGPLGPFLLSAPLIRNLSSETKTLDGAWIHQFMTQLGTVIDKAARILFKSMGGLLAIQERIAERWVAMPPAAENPENTKPPVVETYGLADESTAAGSDKEPQSGESRES